MLEATGTSASDTGQRKEAGVLGRSALTPSAVSLDKSHDIATSVSSSVSEELGVNPPSVLFPPLAKFKIQ